MIKKIFYRVFSLLFNLFRLFSVKSNLVIMLSPHRGEANDSLHVLEDYLTQKDKYEVKYVYPASSTSHLNDILRFFLVDSYNLARGKYIFMNDNFMPLAYLKFSEESVITQLWHGEGAFKKFGLGSPLSEDISKIMVNCSKNLSYVVCTSENVIPIYAEAFGVPVNRVLSLGSPRSDRLTKSTDVDNLRNSFDKTHPECKGKKLVLYAPTFRDNKEKDAEILNHIDIDLFNSNLGKNYSLLIKLHPQIHTSSVPSNIINVTSEDIYNLSLISDILITDYSSVCMDFALLGKKCIFFAYDKADFSGLRSFYFDYDSYVPGPVCSEFSSVIKEISSEPDLRKINQFVSFNFDKLDGKSCERIFSKIIDN